MMDALDIYNEARQKMDELVQTLPQARASDCGLDPRAGQFWVDDDAGVLIIRSNMQALKYYGGFEYVNDDYVIELAGYTIYDEQDSRVGDVIEAWRAAQ